jgi:hypothetical protein
VVIYCDEKCVKGSDAGSKLKKKREQLQADKFMRKRHGSNQTLEFVKERGSRNNSR